MTESFSLLDQPWILTTLTDGSAAELSLREIFDGSIQSHPFVVTALCRTSPSIACC